MTNILDRVKPLIVSLRQGAEIKTNWTAFRVLVEGEIEEVCGGLSTRWLVSICDTYVDLGSDVERRNAMLVSMMVNMEKVSQTYLHWRVNYQDPFVVPEDSVPQRPRLWDNMISMDLEVGDVTNNMFRRLNALMAPTPHIKRIFHEVTQRMKDGDTVLAALNTRHGHVFDPHLQWLESPQYDRWREVGRLPPLKKKRAN